jgi:hypothetical protein
MSESYSPLNLGHRGWSVIVDFDREPSAWIRFWTRLLLGWRWEYHPASEQVQQK